MRQSPLIIPRIEIIANALDERKPLVLPQLTSIPEDYVFFDDDDKEDDSPIYQNGAEVADDGGKRVAGEDSEQRDDN